MSERVGKADIIFVGLIFVVAMVFCIAFYAFNQTKGDYVLVTVDGAEFGRYSISEDAVIDIKNSQGNITNTLTIKDNSAYISNGDCPDKICQKHKAISVNHQTIVCLPNKVVVEIVSTTDSDVDAVAN